MRKITYCEAINEALRQLMEKDSSVFVIGQGVTSPWYVGGTCKDLLDCFGARRVIDTPVSENAVTAAAVGAALAGLRPILVFPRMDFMMYAMDPIINHAAKWSYMFGGRASVPLVIWAIISRFGSQGCQHSQDFTWLFSCIPGLKVVSPTTPYFAKGLLCAAVEDPNPVLFVDNRARYSTKGEVPESLYKVSLKKWSVRDRESYFKRNYPVPCSEVLEKAYFERMYS